jgi:signal peptidase I
MLRQLLSSPATAAAALVTASAAKATLELRTATVAGTSMAPTFETATTILVKHFLPAVGQADRGDVVVLRSPEKGSEHELLTKRVVAVAGDWLYSREGRLVRVPTEHCWVEGDNASNSNDSTHYGAVPCANLAGTVVAKIWPPTQIGAVADRRDECQSRVISSDAASRLRSRPTETGETLRAALHEARGAMLAYTQDPMIVSAQSSSAA